MRRRGQVPPQPIGLRAKSRFDRDRVEPAVEIDTLSPATEGMATMPMALCVVLANPCLARRKCDRRLPVPGPQERPLWSHEEAEHEFLLSVTRRDLGFAGVVEH